MKIVQISMTIFYELTGIILFENLNSLLIDLKRGVCRNDEYKNNCKLSSTISRDS